MDAIALAVGVIEIVLAVVINVVHLRKPLTGPPLRIYQGAMVLTALSLSLLAGATMIVEPESRGFFVMLAASAAVGIWFMRSKASGQRVGPLHSETEAATQPAGIRGYTVRLAPQAAPAHSNVRAQRSARVRRIMAMEE